MRRRDAVEVECQYLVSLLMYSPWTYEVVRSLRNAASSPGHTLSHRLSADESPAVSCAEESEGAAAPVVERPEDRVLDVTPTSTLVIEAAAG